MLKIRYAFALILAMGLVYLLVIPAAGDSDPEESYASYFLYLGDHPADAHPGWHENVQGITHDQDHWFITQESVLWKIPVGHNLGHGVGGNPDVRAVTIGQIPELDNAGYDHFGDLTWFEFEEDGYLVVPVAGENRSAIAVFRAADLGYLGRDYVHPGDADHPAKGGDSFAAVDPAGYVYTNTSQWWTLYKYRLIWDALPDKVNMGLIGSVDLYDYDWSVLPLPHLQGGVFSESGHLLYLVSGYCDGYYENDGINVFDTRTWRRIRRSTNGEMPFNYRFDPEEVGCLGEEPEGATIWDLDDGRAPGISGQLHVLMLDNDWPSDDDVYLKHYTEAITVDTEYRGDEYGTPLKPFNTVGEAYDMAWDGQRIKIRAGIYPERLTLSRRIQVWAIDGVVTIGE